MNDNYFFFDPDQLISLGQKMHDEYMSAPAFPHIVLDDFVPVEVVKRAAADFPKPDFEGFLSRDNPHQVNKRARVQESYFNGISPFLRHFIQQFNDHVMLDFLESLTGFSGIIPDPHFYGGALHQILPGGKLDVHADFNRDDRRQLDRRINVLLYLNDDWQEEWGGDLELWSTDMSERIDKVSPILNRCVIFSTSDHSFHGHPEPLQCPEGRTRNSLAFYYYTNGREDGSVGEGMYKTLWKDRGYRPH